MVIVDVSDDNDSEEFVMKGFAATIFERFASTTYDQVLQTVKFDDRSVESSLVGDKCVKDSETIVSVLETTVPCGDDPKSTTN